MEIMSIQEAYGRKFARQKNIKELQYHALGSCVHVGKISPGCLACYSGDAAHINCNAGIKCNLRCVYCVTRPVTENHSVTTVLKPVNEVKEEIVRSSKNPNFKSLIYSFSGQGDPLANFDFVSEIAAFINKATRHVKKKPWLYLYTNGMLANKEKLLKLKDLGFDEIRFHLGGSNFSKKAYANMAMAVRYFNTITVETPAWPLHRKQLFAMLPIIEDIGVKHLNLGELELNENNLKRVIQALPKAKIYPCQEIHLYDQGLTYDIIEKVIRKKYSFSVLDCSCFTKLIQRGKAKRACTWDLLGLTDPVL